MAGVRSYCYIDIGLKSLAPINGLTRLLALASCSSTKWPFDRSGHFCCQRLHRSIRTTEDVKIFLVVRRGWQLRNNRRSVTEEVRKRETHGDISSEEFPHV